MNSTALCPSAGRKEITTSSLQLAGASLVLDTFTHLLLNSDCLEELCLLVCSEGSSIAHTLYISIPVLHMDLIEWLF